MQKEGSTSSAFMTWYASRQEAMRQDELLWFIHEPRTADFHEGRHRLQFATGVKRLNTKEAGPPPSPGSKVVIAIDNPPKRHLGRALSKHDPVTIREMALAFYEQLLQDAMTVVQERCTRGARHPER